MAKILFIHKLWYESLGIMQLSAVVKKAGHKSYLHMDNGNTRRLIQFAREVQPDIVGFSLMTGQHLWALQIAAILKDKLKKIKPLIIFGGIHPTFVPEIVEKDHVDIICRGEGEGALLDLMNSIDKKNSFSNIPNLWVKKDGKVIKNKLRPLIEDLDYLPFPDRDLFYQYSYFRDNPNRTVLASRGCPFNCSFCFNGKYRQLYKVKIAKARRRSCRNVIEEIKLLKVKYKKTKIIRFQDDILTLDRKWLYYFLEIYKREVNIPLVCYIRADTENEETIRKLSESGCIQVTFGVETGNEDLRNQILNKKVSNEQIYTISCLLKKYNISFYVNSIFFIPGSTINDAWETVKINQKIRPDHIIGNVFQPYPSSALYEALLKSDLIRKNHFDNMNDLYSYSIVNSKHSKLEENIFYFFPLLVKLPSLTPLVKKLVKIKPNIFFVLIFKITAGIDTWLRNRLSFTRFVREAYHHYNFK